jgi:hypothetical protein
MLHVLYFLVHQLRWSNIFAAGYGGLACPGFSVLQLDSTAVRLLAHRRD